MSEEDISRGNPDGKALEESSPVKLEEYRIASDSLQLYERYLVNSTPMLFSFAIPLFSVGIGALSLGDNVERFAIVVGTFISIAMWISVERIRVSYWDKFNYVIEIEKSLGLEFWQSEKSRLRSASLFMRVTPSPARLRSLYYFIASGAFLYLLVTEFSLGGNVASWIASLF